jgi:DNA-binding NarL/FixJ family response regulator
MLRVYIADDSVAFGTLAAAWLEQTDDLRVVGAAQTMSAALTDVVAHAPDVVIVDRLLPQPEHSAAVMAHVREQLPSTAILLVSGMPESGLAGEAAAVSADGYVSKAANAQALAEAVRAAAAHRSS